MFAETHGKITAEQLKREAFLYVRQSTPRQVFENTESTKRQYALRDRAVALGWPIERIHVIDNDQGRSGAEAQGREGFQQLVAAVALGQAGIVMGLEVSRLARNNADWHRLIELCALSATLICDEDGVYDPAQFNDRLLLGLKGTMSEAELHILKARLRGGILNKARRGELVMRLPIGLVPRADGQVGLDPDQQIQSSVRWVFDTFEREGSAMKTLKLFRAQGLRFPKRLYGGPHKGEIIWGDIEHTRVLELLHNPRYAGAFVFGRTRSRRLPSGGSTYRELPRSQWQVVIPDAHAGYITWQQFEANQRRLLDNARAYGVERRGGPPREGCALLQGRVLCGRCGERMSVRYEKQAAGLVPIYYCASRHIRAGEGVCQAVAGKIVDPAVSALLLETVAPAALEVALAVQREIEQRIEQAESLRLKQVEQARYEAEIAKRRFLRCDPDNRLVAGSLEADWNDKLRGLQQAQEEYERRHNAARSELDQATRAKVLALAQDFPRVWNDPRTAQRERKRMLALLIEDVTLIYADVITVHIRFRGGQTRTLSLERPRPIAQIRKTKPELLAEIDRLLEMHEDREVVALLNERGWRTSSGKPLTLFALFRLRQAYGLNSRLQRLRARGAKTAEELAKQLRVSDATIRGWGRKGLLQRWVGANGARCLYQLPTNARIIKGRGQRHAKVVRRNTCQPDR